MRKSIFMMMLVSLSIAVFAQDAIIKNGISLGGGSVLGNEKAGGFGDFGFGIFQKGSFFMRNHITFEGGGLGSKGGYIEIGDNLLLGSYRSITENFGIRSYGLIGFGFGMFYGENKKINEGFILSPKAGSGMEFVFGGSDKPQGSFFIETLGTAEVIVGDGGVGLLNQKYPNFENTYLMIRIGGRTYF